MKRAWPLLIGATVVLVVGAGPAMAAPVAKSHGAAPRTPAAVPVYVQWLRVEMHRPRTLFVGGTLKCANSTLAHICPSWIMRSTDGGNTWADLSEALGTDRAFGVYALSPVTIADDGRHLFIAATWDGGSPASEFHGIVRSGDGGLTWQSSGQPGSYGGGYGRLALSPVDNRRLYAVDDSGNGGGSYVVFSDDYGATWHPAGNPGSLAGPSSGAGPGPYGLLFADPTRLNTVYANVADYRETTNGAGYTVSYLHPDFAARSDDKGVHWTMVMTPTVSPSLQTFTISGDPHEGSLLVGRTADAGVPADRRYLSGDAGATWTGATCPGDAGGTCPALTVDNVFGAGAAYGFVHDGIYPFHEGGAAGARLGISSNLPFHTADLIDVGAGTRAGDPVYLLGQGVRANVHGLLYRSTDGGKSWQALPAGVLPNLAPPSKARGTLYVPQTNHSVAAPFVSTYRRMSLLILGYPITEAYQEGDTLVQDFDHLRLELRGGHAVVVALGADLYGYRPGDLANAVKPVANTPARLYFSRTHHILQGDMLRFWQTHGGMDVFGAPISEIVKATNGDGSGRSYEMQWFQNARLERHPETHNPRYAILLGLLGHESLRARGWAP